MMIVTGRFGLKTVDLGRPGEPVAARHARQRPLRLPFDVDSGVPG